METLFSHLKSCVINNRMLLLAEMTKKMTGSGQRMRFLMSCDFNCVSYVIEIVKSHFITTSVEY